MLDRARRRPERCNRMARLGVVFLPKRSMGSLDAMLPLMVLFKENGARLATIVLNDSVAKMIESSKFHADSFRALSSYTELRGGGVAGKLWKSVRLVAALAAMRMTCRRVVILSSLSYNEFLDRVLLRLLNWFGKTIWFPGNPIGETKEFATRFGENAWRKLVDVGAKKRNRPTNIVHEAVCYRDDEIALMKPRFAADAKFNAIGTPRFHRKWQTYLMSRAGHYVRDELRLGAGDALSGDIVTIIVPAPEYFWFDDKDGCYRLVSEILDVVEKTFEKPIVFIKTKPQHLDKFRSNLSIASDRVRFTTLGLSVLAGVSKVAFAVQETSGLIDFLIMGVPVIEYGQYSSAWLKICPGGSAYRNYPGVTHVESRSALAHAVADARSGRLRRCTVGDLHAFLGDNSDPEEWISKLSGQLAQ
jgi:hypothetical protein